MADRKAHTVAGDVLGTVLLAMPARTAAWFVSRLLSQPTGARFVTAITVCPVGWLATARAAWWHLRHGRPGGAWAEVAVQARRTVWLARRGDWAAVRGTVAGLVAFHHDMPWVCPGRGWATRRALRRLLAHLAASRGGVR